MPDLPALGAPARPDQSCMTTRPHCKLLLDGLLLLENVRRLSVQAEGSGEI
jgi:hypothetical protein